MNKITEIIINSATFGEQNPLPDMRSSKKILGFNSRFEVSDNVTDEEKKYLGVGKVAHVSPYKLQDRYDRVKKPKKHKAVVLENEYLKAVFLPEFGGKMWSLYDKKHKKDLLYTNSVLQPCNLALRDAWLSGGVEFNLGVKGHNPFTCSPMFCELIGDDAVRFYEYERIRGLAYSVTAYLPEGSAVLYIRTRVENTSNESRYMYWWTNIAFPEKPTTRVVVPAHEAFYCSYLEDHYLVEKKAVPFCDGIDGTFSMNRKNAIDNFYNIPANEDKWIVAADPDGSGLLQYSDKRLKSRKLFLWGASRGGRHWNEFLSEKGQAYIELQAGILNTQLEHIPMPAHEVWEWTEGYTYIDGSDKRLYGEWDGAIGAVKEHLNALINSKKAIAPGELPSIKIGGAVKKISDGSGFGALENRVRALKGESLISDELLFDSPLSDEQAKDFNDLLDNGYIAYRSPEEYPISYINGDFWHERLLASAKTSGGDHWYTYYQAGVTAYIADDFEQAKLDFENSVKKEPSLWAYRCLAMIYFNDYSDAEKGLDFMKKAYKQPIARDCYAFLNEYAVILLENEKYPDVVALYEALSPELKAEGRLRLAYAQALLGLNLPERAAEVLTPDFVLNNLKEGERSLSNLWTDIYTAICKKQGNLSDEEARALANEKYPVPYSLEFRMFVE